MKDDLKSKILESSLELMKDGDVSALSMRAVARRAGVSHQAPYHYFADREAILAELVRGGFEKLHEYLETAVAEDGEEEERVIAMGQAYVRFAIDNAALFRLMYRCDMVDLDNHEDARAAADKALDVPFRVIGGKIGGDEDLRRMAVIGAWSLAHGLATLNLEGILDKKLTETGPPTDEFIRKTLGLYVGNLLFPKT